MIGVGEGQSGRVPKHGVSLFVIDYHDAVSTGPQPLQRRFVDAERATGEICAGVKSEIELANMER
jgi:hypothetical protein